MTPDPACTSALRASQWQKRASPQPAPSENLPPGAPADHAGRSLPGRRYPDDRRPACCLDVRLFQPGGRSANAAAGSTLVTVMVGHDSRASQYGSHPTLTGRWYLLGSACPSQAVPLNRAPDNPWHNAAAGKQCPNPKRKRRHEHHNSPQPLSAGPRRLARAPHRSDPRTRRCRSSIRTTICGSGPTGATCWTTCWPTPTAATTSSPPCSSSAARCTAPTGRRRSGRSAKPNSSTASRP